jgi:hypothetical protein
VRKYLAAALLTFTAIAVAPLAAADNPMRAGLSSVRIAVAPLSTDDDDTVAPDTPDVAPPDEDVVPVPADDDDVVPDVTPADDEGNGLLEKIPWRRGVCALKWVMRSVTWSLYCDWP